MFLLPDFTKEAIEKEVQYSIEGKAVDAFVTLQFQDKERVDALLDKVRQKNAEASYDDLVHLHAYKDGVEQFVVVATKGWRGFEIKKGVEFEFNPENLKLRISKDSLFSKWVISESVKHENFLEKERKEIEKK